MTWLRTSPRKSLGIAGMVTACMILAVAMRVLAITGYGGGTSYLEWAKVNYFGGITPTYLMMSSEAMNLSYSSTAYPPGYPIFLAIARLAGANELHAIRIVQALLDSIGAALSCWILIRAGARPALAVCAAAVYATYPLWAVGSTFLLAEFASPVMMLAIMGLLLSGGDRPTPGVLVCALCGAIAGLASLVRPDLLLLPLALGAWLLWRHSGRQGVAAVAALWIAFAIPVGAWGLHNRLQHGHWIFATTAGGNTLWEGLGSLPNDYGYELSDERAAAILRQKGFAWHSVDADRYFKSEYLRAWKDHPEYVISVIVNRIRFVLMDSEVWLPESRPLYLLKRAFDYGGAFLVLGVLWLVRRSHNAVLVVALPAFYAVASLGMTHWEARYGRYVHLSYLFSLVLLASYVVDRLPRLPRLGATVVAGLCVATAWAAADALLRAAETAGRAREAAVGTACERGADFEASSPSLLSPCIGAVAIDRMMVPPTVNSADMKVRLS